jgi:hypothetical protein
MFAEEDRVFAAFLRGARQPVVKDALFQSYRRDGADLHRLWRAQHVARRLRVARPRSAGVVWVHPIEKHLPWRLGEAAKKVGLTVRIVDARVPPVDAEEGLLWSRWRRKTFDLEFRLRSQGYAQAEFLCYLSRLSLVKVHEALDAHPDLFEVHPSRYWRGSGRGGRTTVRLERWVTPTGMDLAQAAAALAAGQKIGWSEALDLVGGQRA